VIIFTPALASRCSVDHYPKSRVLRLFLTGCCISVIVANNFPAVSLLFQAGLADFGLLTGFCIDPVIADIFSASSCPEERGMPSSFLWHFLTSFSCDQDFRLCRPFDLMLWDSLTGHCISITVASNFPAASFPDLHRYGSVIFHSYTGIDLVLIIADDLSASSFPIESGRYKCSKSQ
jgi:hypothetical protein